MANGGVFFNYEPIIRNPDFSGISYLGINIVGAKGYSLKVNFWGNNKFSMQVTLFDTFGAGIADAQRDYYSLGRMYISQYFKNYHND
jgi:hypothetical protein